MRFFNQPILNSPYESPSQHWELDEHGHPTNRSIPERRSVAFITPIPQPRTHGQTQREIVFDQASRTIGTDHQQYHLAHVVNDLRHRVDSWRRLPNPNQWRVTPETARLLRHWRHHRFSNVRPFFCQVEAVETVIWLTEVAPKLGREGRRFLDHLDAANEQANPATAPTASPAGSSTPTTTKKASSSATPTSSAPMIRISRSKSPSKPTSTRKPGPRSTATRPAPSPNPHPAASPSKSSTTSGTR